MYVLGDCPARSVSVLVTGHDPRSVVCVVIHRAIDIELSFEAVKRNHVRIVWFLLESTVEPSLSIGLSESV